VLSLSRLKEILFEKKSKINLTKRHYRIQAHSGRNLATSKQALSTSVADYQQRYGYRRQPKAGFSPTSYGAQATSRTPIPTHKGLRKLVRSRAYDPSQVSRKND
jgi:hypothetical protein